jgi:hypothetical protein
LQTVGRCREITLLHARELSNDQAIGDKQLFYKHVVFLTALDNLALPKRRQLPRDAPQSCVTVRSRIKMSPARSFYRFTIRLLPMCAHVECVLHAHSNRCRSAGVHALRMCRDEPAKMACRGGTRETACRNRADLRTLKRLWRSEGRFDLILHG